MARKFTFTTQVYDKKTDFPQTGDVDVIYIDASKNLAYRYDDTYQAISSSEVDIWGALGDLSKKGGGALWGTITGTLSNQTDLDAALRTKQNSLVSGTNIKTIEGQSLLGSGDIDLTKTDVGLGNVDNTSDLNKPISTATQTALNAKQDTIVSGTNIKTINGSSILGSGNLVVGGGGGGTHVIVKPQTGNQVSALIASTNSGFNVGAIGFRMQAFPFYPASSFTSSSLTLNVTTSIAGGIARILIYSDVNGKPSVKLFESADLNCSTIGLKTASTTFNFVAGTKYWIAVQSNNASIAFTLQPQNYSTIVSSFGLATRYTSYVLNSIAIGSAPATWTGGTLHVFEFPFVYITSA